MLVQCKAIKSGNVVELYSYSKGYYINDCKLQSKSRNKLGRSIKTTTADKKQQNRQATVYTARKNLRQLINSNYNMYKDSNNKIIKTKFLTLTFSDSNITESKASTEFKKFIKKLNYKVFNTKKAELKYTAVISKQKRQAIHYHVLLYNIDYIATADLKSLWKHGYLKINRAREQSKAVYYMCKHIDVSNTVEGKQYTNSKDLLQPVEILDPGEIEKICNDSKLELVYENESENDYLGKIDYKQYKLK